MFATAGGGGWGNPLYRSPEKVLEDVLDVYVSLEGAKQDYGVVIDRETMQVDYTATKELREKLAASDEYQRHFQGIRKDYVRLIK